MDFVFILAPSVQLVNGFLTQCGTKARPALLVELDQRND